VPQLLARHRRALSQLRQYLAGAAREPRSKFKIIHGGHRGLGLRRGLGLESLS
jgi:hypothetical protein